MGAPTQPPGELGLATLKRYPEFNEIYELVAVLGRGGMATVARAVHRATGREVAVKVLDTGAMPSAAERIVREGQVLAKVRHPGIVQVYDAGMVGDCPYLVLELATGGSLRERLDACGPMSLAQVSEIMAPALRALAALHEQGVLHRDLKPDNILFGHDGLPRLADFGLALEPDSVRLTDPQMFIGTVRYSAPEVITGDASTPFSDIYAVGATLHELFAGRPPFDAEPFNDLVAAIANLPAPSLATVRPDLPREVVDLVARCLAKHPQDRPQSAAKLAAEVAAWGAPVMRATSTARMLVQSVAPHALAIAVALSGLCLVASAALGVRWLASQRAQEARPAAPVVEVAPSAIGAAEDAVAASRRVIQEAEQRWTEVASFTIHPALSADLMAKAQALVAPQVEARAELARRLAPLREAAGRGRVPDRVDYLLTLGAALELGHWYFTEQCQRATAEMDLPPAADSTEGRAQLAAELKGVALFAELQQRSTVVLARAATDAALDGGGLAALYEGIYRSSHALIFLDWAPGNEARLKRATALWMQDLAEIGDERRPVGRAAHGCWEWGGANLSHKADRERVRQALADVRLLTRACTRGGDALDRLAGRIENDLARAVPSGTK